MTDKDKKARWHVRGGYSGRTVVVIFSTIIGLTALWGGVPVQAGPLDRGPMQQRFNPAAENMLRIPGVVGMYEADASATLQQSGLAVDIKYIKEENKQYAGKEGTVIKQVPAAAGVAMLGSSVTITVYAPPVPEPEEAQSDEGVFADESWGGQEQDRWGDGEGEDASSGGMDWGGESGWGDDGGGWVPPQNPVPPSNEGDFFEPQADEDSGSIPPQMPAQIPPQIPSQMPSQVPSQVPGRFPQGTQPQQDQPLFQAEPVAPAATLHEGSDGGGASMMTPPSGSDLISPENNPLPKPEQIRRARETKDRITGGLPVTGTDVRPPRPSVDINGPDAGTSTGTSPIFQAVPVDPTLIPGGAEPSDGAPRDKKNGMPEMPVLDRTLSP